MSLEKYFQFEANPEAAMLDYLQESEDFDRSLNAAPITPADIAKAKANFASAFASYKAKRRQVAVFIPRKRAREFGGVFKVKP